MIRFCIYDYIIFCIHVAYFIFCMDRSHSVTQGGASNQNIHKKFSLIYDLFGIYCSQFLESLMMYRCLCFSNCNFLSSYVKYDRGSKSLIIQKYWSWQQLCCVFLSHHLEWECIREFYTLSTISLVMVDDELEILKCVSHIIQFDFVTHLKWKLAKL